MKNIISPFLTLAFGAALLASCVKDTGLRNAAGGQGSASNDSHTSITFNSKDGGALEVTPVQVKPVEVNASGTVQVDTVKFNKVEVAPVGIGPVEVRASKPLDVQVTSKVPVQISGKLDDLNVKADVEPVQVVIGDKPINAILDVRVTNLSLGTLPLQITVTSTPTRVELVMPEGKDAAELTKTNAAVCRAKKGGDSDPDESPVIYIYAAGCILAGGLAGAGTRQIWMWKFEGVLLQEKKHPSPTLESPQKSQPEDADLVISFWKRLYLGIIAAALVPLFLKFISSDILTSAPTKPMSMLAFLGLCIIAGFLGEDFIFKILEMTKKWISGK
jgi:hypothetical protein